MLVAAFLAAAGLVTVRSRVVGTVVEASARWSDADVVLRVGETECQRGRHHLGGEAEQQGTLGRRAGPGSAAGVESDEAGEACRCPGLSCSDQRCRKANSSCS
ncbi:hypothetical protein BOX37_19200 [Nocardia mangyaensis]|uniref:Uncharacterized protein n=1 Tax=Nocardia mangyaensis TaxID=2213200 RepID=A0A1J0VUP6_9NOCA|nr:hypothetical protein BOX37_19200 [Nocardia mangyaensis]